MLAKIQGAKRKRAEDEDVDMDEDDEEEDDDDDEGEENWMDVDGGEASKKRLKTNSGGVVNKREPRSHRHLAGMRDEGVSLGCSFFCRLLLRFVTILSSSSKQLVQSNYATSVKDLAICWRKQERAIVRSKRKW